MKKYTLFSFVFILSLILLGFSGVKSASAANCAPGDLFSTVTGQSCSTNPHEVVGCQTGYLFSPVTGQSCSGATSGGGSGGPSDNSSVVAQFNNLFKSTITIGSRGDNIKALQKFLKDQGYYFGKIDGKYGKISARAVSDFQDDNHITNPPISANLPCTDVTGTTCSYVEDLCWYPSNKNLPACNANSPVISGVDGPQTLNVNQQGTWSVTASDPNGGNLSYSVTWGDEGSNKTYSSANIGAALGSQVATFNHTYSQAGNYKPTFTVTNFNGKTAQTSLSVNVGNVVSTSNGPKITIISAPQSVTVGQQVTFSFSATNPKNSTLGWNGMSAGSSSSCGQPSGTKSTYTFCRSWNTAGSYLVKVDVSDNFNSASGGFDSWSDSVSFTVNVGNVVVPTQTTTPITILSPLNDTFQPGQTVTISWYDDSQFAGKNALYDVWILGDINKGQVGATEVKFDTVSIPTQMPNVRSVTWTVPSSYSGTYKASVSEQDPTNSAIRVVATGSSFLVNGSSASTSTIKDLVFSANNNVASGNIIIDSTNAVVGSYVISNPTSENIAISNFRIPWVFHDYKLFINGVQFSSSTPDTSSGINNFFTGTPIIVAANSKIIIDLKTDTISSQFLSVGSIITTKLDVCTGFGSTYPTYHCIQQTGQTMNVVQ